MDSAKDSNKNEINKRQILCCQQSALRQAQREAKEKAVAKRKGCSNAQISLQKEKSNKDDAAVGVSCGNSLAASIWKSLKLIYGAAVADLTQTWHVTGYNQVVHIHLTFALLVNMHEMCALSEFSIRSRP